MPITNPTKYTLRKIHKFDLYHHEIDQRVLIDVLEPIGKEDPAFIAIPYLLGYKCDESVAGVGGSVEEALNDCLQKASSMSWDDFMQRVHPVAE